MKWIVISALLIGITGIGGFEQTSATRTDMGAYPVLINTCLISRDTKTLTAFYAQILKTEPQFDSGNYVEFRTGAGVLAIFDAAGQEKYIPGSATGQENRSMVLEFRVNDVDAEYARLKGVVKTWVKGPTTQPWGTRSIYFRDPDRSLVDFFTVVRARTN